MSYPTCKTGGVMNSNRNIQADQLELGFNPQARYTPPQRRTTRIERAAWWFGKMRAAVDSAMVWTPKPTPPPEQIWFAQ
jgi:hypothetical protein